jgi:hypothetical protein
MNIEPDFDMSLEVVQERRIEQRIIKIASKFRIDSLLIILMINSVRSWLAS